MATPADGFTPMQLMRDGGRLTLCAYSGCWSGTIGTSHSTGAITFAVVRMVREGRDVGEEATQLTLIHDAQGGTAQMLWNGYANVMECGAKG